MGGLWAPWLRGDLQRLGLLSYGTPEERAAWEAASRPPLDAAGWPQALGVAYAEAG